MLSGRLTSRRGAPSWPRCTRSLIGRWLGSVRVVSSPAAAAGLRSTDTRCSCRLRKSGFCSNRRPPQRPLDRGESCPWQDQRGRCTARAARPLGCRVYFCDPMYQHAGEEISERFIGQLKQLTETHGLPWNDAPLHHHLERERDRGAFPIDVARLDPERFHEPPSGHRREASPVVEP